MSERVTSADVAFLHRETRTVPQHLGGLVILAPRPGGFDYLRLVRLIEERISLAPRYRQKVRAVPGQLANPMWIDDPHFDITYHVRRSALPRPGTDAELLEFSARILSRLLDRSRPLWEMYLVDGLSDGRVAIVTKTHEAMVDETHGVDLAQVILDAAPEPRRTVSPVWMPAAEPTSLELVRAAVGELLRRPLSTASRPAPPRGPAARILTLAGDAVTTAGSLVSTAVATSTATLGAAGAVLTRRQAGRARSPLNVDLGEQRRLAIARTRLEDFRRIRDAFGTTVNDVMLAVIAGALRGWLLARAEPLDPGATVRALVPVSVQDPRPERPAHDAPPVDWAGPQHLGAPGNGADTARSVSGARVSGAGAGAGAGARASGAGASGAGADGNAAAAATGGDAGTTATGAKAGTTGEAAASSSQVRPLLVDLPVGEPDPVLRLAQVRYAMALHRRSSRAIDADRIAELTGLAPPTLHALGARAASGLARRLFSLVVTNVPGPQVPLYAAGARMTEMFPVLPLVEGQGLSIALTSYDGGVFFGLNADRDGMRDVALIAELIEESLADLLAAADSASAVAGAGLAAARQPGDPGPPGRRRPQRPSPPDRTD